MGDSGDIIKTNKEYKEVEPNPDCKMCKGMGYQTYGNDCTCIWEEIDNDN